MLLYVVLVILLLYGFLVICLKRITKAQQITTTVTKEIDACDVPEDIRKLVEAWSVKSPSDFE